MSKRPGLNADKVVDAALDLIRSDGTQALTLNALAQRLGIRPPSLYNHVTSLADVHRRLRLRGLLELQKAMLDACLGRAGYEALAAICQAYRQFGRDNPALYDFTLAATTEQDAEIQEAGQQLLKVTFAVLQGYGLEGDDLVHGTRSLRSSLHGFVSLECGGAFAMACDLDETFRLLVNNLDRMFHAWGNGER
jgi:AcrR family transcriptional regulator